MPKSKKTPKPKNPPEPHFQKMVEVFFAFTEEKFGVKPSFQGSQPRDLKYILQSLRKRCEEGNIEWTELEAERRVKSFLQWAYTDAWLRQHWMLSNIQRFKDTIFIRAEQYRRDHAMQ